MNSSIKAFAKISMFPKKSMSVSSKSSKKRWEFREQDSCGSKIAYEDTASFFVFLK